jgi:hypothetical protein
MTKALRAAAAVFDIRDAFFFGGLAIAGCGGAAISWRWTLVILGAIIALKGYGPIVIGARSE